MPFDRLSYVRDWNNPADFATYEDSEAQVRADLQFHPDAVRDFLNDGLIPALEGEGGAAKIGSSGGESVQAVLDQCVSDIGTLAAGGVPSVSQCTRVIFTVDEWTVHEATDADASYATLDVPEDAHKRAGDGFGFALWHNVGGALMNDTWAVAGTRVVKDADTGAITLRSPEAFAGEVVFFGV